MKESQRQRRVFVTKHTVGMCGVGKFMKWWKTGLWCLSQVRSARRCKAHVDLWRAGSWGRWDTSL
jgi:hypothetical protein